MSDTQAAPAGRTDSGAQRSQTLIEGITLLVAGRVRHVRPAPAAASAPA